MTTTSAPDDQVRRAVAAVWRMESARLVATLTRHVGDLGLAEDLAQEALLEALEKWPGSGVPRNPGAWLTTVAKRRAIDGWRRRDRLDERHAAMARDLEHDVHDNEQPWDPDDIDDDVLRLVFISCHPVLSREARIALTLRVVGGLSSEEIARAFLVPTPTVQQRIVRAKKTLAAAKVPFEVPEPEQYAERLGSVLSVIYLIFNEAYAASAGSDWMRPDFAGEALRLGRVLAGRVSHEPEVHGLVALMEFHASRFAARRAPDGSPVLLADQDRRRWDRAQITRGNAALARADALGRGRGAYALQAAIAQCHATAATAEDTAWGDIVVLYEALGRLVPSAVVELNRAVAVSMIRNGAGHGASGPAAALARLGARRAPGRLGGDHLLPRARAERRFRPGGHAEARAGLDPAARRAGNGRERAVLMAKAATLGGE